MFGKYEVDPFPVHDSLNVRNGNDTIALSVKADPAIMVVNLNKAQKKLEALTDKTSEEDRIETAKFFAETIFGKEQAEQLLKFYDNDPIAVITVCGKYFSERLSKLLTKAQKKRKK